MLEQQYLPIQNSTEIASLLENASKELAHSTIWTHDRTESFVAQLHRADCTTQTLGFSFSSLPASRGIASRVLHPQSDYFIHIQGTQAFLYFKSALKGIGETECEFTLPRLAFRIQRRRHVRAPLPIDGLLKTTFADPLRRENILPYFPVDLSASGIGVFTPENRKEHFEPQRILEQLTFELGGKIYQTRAEIRWKAPGSIPNFDNGSKMGLLFLDLTPKESLTIDQFVRSKK